MQIIGAGFGRTGTLSLKIALEQLGFDPCYHMAEVIAPRPGVNDGHLSAWADFAAGRKPMDWRWLFQGYRATVDFPACKFYRDLTAIYPEAKVILTTRDAEKWFKSWASLWAAVDEINQPGKVVRGREFFSFTENLIRTGMFGGRIEHDSSIAEFNRHNAEVIATVPPEKLLVFQVDQGWGPLCAFLNVPAPDTPFPHVNEAAGMAEKMKPMFWGQGAPVESVYR